MTSTKEIKEMLTTLIPADMRADGLIETGLIKVGIIDMSCALDIDDLSFKKDLNSENINDPDYIITPDLTLVQKRLASYYCYLLYLEKLKLSLNQDAINFSTLTFSIKGLEKRPEAVNDQIYMVRRYLASQVDLAKGSAAILGTARQFGAGL